MPSLFANEYYIVDFENTNKTLTEEEEKTLMSFLNSDIYTIKESDNITITKIVYQYPFQHESVCYIFFKTNIDKRLPYTLIKTTENSKEYVRKHVCMDTNDCEEFNFIRKTVKSTYNWMENNEKQINYTEIQEPYRTEKKIIIY